MEAKIVDGVLVDYDSDEPTLDIPDGVKKVGNVPCFRRNIFKKIIVPASLEYLNAEAFVICNEIDEIEVRGYNPRYYSAGNCLIERDTATLVLGARKNNIPKDGSVRRIGSYAFGGTSDCGVFIPKCIEEIEENAFWFNTGICVYVEAAEKPDGWHEDWCPCGITEDQIWWEAGDPDIVIYWNWTKK